MKTAVAEDLRRTLLDASLELIATEGLEKLSMREVARRAGVSHQAPYHYFPDREAILAEIVAEGFQKLRDDSLKGLAKAPDGPPKLTALGRSYIRFALNNPAHFKLMFRSELVRADRHTDADECATKAFDVLVDVVDEVSTGLYGKPDQALVFTAWSMAHGLATLLLEGKLDKMSGKSKRAQLATADEVLERFERLLSA